MPTNTTYNPQNINEFEKSKLYIAATGVSAVVPNGTTSNLDLTLTNDYLLTGLMFFTDGPSAGDYVQLQVVDVSGSITGTPGSVLLQPATNWYIAPSTPLFIDADYPAKVIAGLTLRIVYTNVGIGIGSTSIYCNYKLHKVLV